MQIKVQFRRQDGLFTGFSVTGHDAVQADSECSVLCAAVSSAVMLTLNTLTECFGVPENACVVHPGAGTDNRISLRLQRTSKTQSDILRGLYLHCNALAEDYQGRLSVTVREQ